MTTKTDETLRAQARAEGIVLTPAGEPLFSRDLNRWRALKSTPLPLTDAQRDEDAADAV